MNKVGRRAKRRRSRSISGRRSRRVLYCGWRARPTSGARPKQTVGNLALSSKEYVVKLNGAITPSSAGTIVAVADRLFGREGLSVSLLSGGGDADAIASVVADDRVIGLASAAGFLQARAEGSPIVAFAASYIVSSVEFYVLPNTKLLTPSDLEGKRIGYKAGPVISAILQAFITRNSIVQSQLAIVESETALTDLLNGKIDVLIGHRDIEGLTLEGIKADYRSLSPDSFGLHAMGFIYFAHERAFSLPGNLENILTGIAKGWDAAYSDYDRTIPLVAGSIDAKSSPALVSRFMDVQRRCLRPFGTRFGELDLRRLRILQSQLLQRRIIKQPVDLTRAATYDILTETYRKESNTLTRIEP